MTSAFEVLQRIAANRKVARPAGERCEMCTEPITDEHSHVVNLAGRQLMCVCRPCYLLFTHQDADLRYRAVPDRYLELTDLALSPAHWDALEIPVGLAFFFRNSVQDRTVAFYPGPAGATESELPLSGDSSVRRGQPGQTGRHVAIQLLVSKPPCPVAAGAAGSIQARFGAQRQ